MPDESRIIVALDMIDPVVARDIAKRIAPEVFAFKVGWPLILGSNADIINDLSRFSKVICDLKVADIPDTNALITQKVKENGAWGIIAHTFLGKDSLEAVVKTGEGLKVFALVAMSHPGSSYFLDKRLKEMARLAVESGAYGVVAPGNKPKILKTVRKLVGSMKIISPGIGTQGGSPAEAIRSGADYIIVGRSICNADDPVAELKKMNAAIRDAK